MRNYWLLVVFTCAACGVNGKDGEPALPKSGAAVTQVAFTTDGKGLVAVESVFFYANSIRENCYTRVRRFSVPDGTIAADTGELQLLDLTFARRVSGSWIAQAMEFDRFGKGNPFAGVLFFELDTQTLERRAIHLIEPEHHYRHFRPSALSCALHEPFCVFGINHFVVNKDKKQPAPIVFDLKVKKKSIALDEDLNTKPTNASARLEYAPNGKTIASFPAVEPLQLQIHDAATGKLLKSRKIESPVVDMKFSPDGKLLVAMCTDGTLLILHSDLSNQIATKQCEGFAFAKYGDTARHVLAFVDNGHLAAVTSDANVELFDTHEWKSVRRFEGPKNRLNCVASSLDGKFLAAGFGDTLNYPGLIRIWEVNTGKLLKELR